jgi:Ran GTPase-activating protein (RanGAP) involved in mRNA processing and transport
MKTKEDLIATCQALRENDPRQTELKLDGCGTLLKWKQVQNIAQALEENKVVEDLTLSRHLCVGSTLLLSHFLRSSPSLRRLEMRGYEPHEEEEEELREIETIKASIVFESISRSSTLIKLSLYCIPFGEHCPLEGFLSSTRTLLHFFCEQNDRNMSYETAQAIGRGFAKNRSLVNLQWLSPYGLTFMGEVLFGLFDHIKLKSLELELSMTESSSQVLRSLLHCNRTLELFKFALHDTNDEFPIMASVLAGLAQNTGLKEVQIGSGSSEIDMTLATAWTDMLRRNTSMKILDLTNDVWEIDVDSKLCSAIAEGLANNSTLETLRLPTDDTSGVDLFNDPLWQEMLKNNHSLKTLSFSRCPITVEGFQSIVRGLSCNASLETLDLSYTGMGESSLIALVDGLSVNKTLKSLDLSQNCALSQSGRAVIERLMGYNVLRELNLFLLCDSVNAATLTSGLAGNHSFEKLDLTSALVDGEGTNTFRALCESLRGNTTLRHLVVGANGVHLDDVCATALKLDTMSLETLDLNCNTVTSCGIGALAHSLQGPCTLKELDLFRCGLDDTGLLKLGEALTTNDVLEVLNVKENNFTYSGVSQFFELLPQMQGLKAVYGLVEKRNGVAPTEAVALALVDGLRENTKLQKIFVDDNVKIVDSSFSLDIAREINYYLALNRCGRTLLRLPGCSEPPSGLWPLLLAKISAPRDTSLLFYFLQNKPKIVKCKAVASHKPKIVKCKEALASRKRKANDDPLSK